MAICTIPPLLMLFLTELYTVPTRSIWRESLSENCKIAKIQTNDVSTCGTITAVCFILVSSGNIKAKRVERLSEIYKKAR